MTIKTTLTTWYGRCYTIVSDKKFSKSKEKFVIKFKPSSDLVAYVHEPGYELWLILGYYPTTLKDLSLVKNEQGVTDFPIQKSVHCNAENCISDPNYNQYKCLIKEFQKQHQNLGIGCVTPWIHNILDASITQNSRSCNESEFRLEHEFSTDFFLKASRNNLGSCLGTLFKYLPYSRISNNVELNFIFRKM